MLDQQCTIIEKIKQTLDENGFEKLFINARTDTYLIEKNPYELTLARVKAYENAGADGVFVPGLCKIEQIKMLVNALNIPINVMAMADFNCPKIAFAAGVKRFSLGNSLYDLVGETLKKHLTQLGNNEPPAIKLIKIQFRSAIGKNVIHIWPVFRFKQLNDPYLSLSFLLFRVNMAVF